MRINNNLMAMNSHRQLGMANNAGASSMEKLSSGMRINRAGDDAAGLAISEKMRGQIRGLNQASRNAQDGISLIQTAEGALNESHAILQRMRELTVQASTETNTASDRAEIQKEVDALVAELDRIAETTEFNTEKLLTGSGDFTIHIGANEGQNMQVTINSMASSGLGVAALDITASGAADAAITTIQSAIDAVTAQRTDLGAVQNRLEHTIKNLDNASENLQAAESRIRDVDMAREMMEMTKQNILQQASTAMLAQANMAPQGVLQLLG